MLRGYNEFVGPGRGDVYVDGDRTLYVHHYYDADDDYLPRLSVREVVWRPDGWPTLSDPLTGSMDMGRGPAYLSFITPDRAGAIGTVPGGRAPVRRWAGTSRSRPAPVQMGSVRLSTTTVWERSVLTCRGPSGTAGRRRDPR